jgi:hypothetical protein
MDAYLSLFGVSFLAATILPAYSELLFAGLQQAGYDPLALWVWATAGNTLGAAFNWVLGRYLLRFQGRRWFPFDANRLGPAQRWFQRYGQWSLLMAWAPVGGGCPDLHRRADAGALRRLPCADRHRQGRSLRDPAGGGRRGERRSRRSLLTPRS